jgi:hypothetical protein
MGLKVEHVLKVVETNVISGKGEILLIEKDLELHEGCVFFPNTRVDTLLYSIDHFLMKILVTNRGLVILVNFLHSFIE